MRGHSANTRTKYTQERGRVRGRGRVRRGKVEVKRMKLVRASSDNIGATLH